MIVFNDSYKSEGFEIGIEEANKILIDLGLHLEYKFIEDYVSDNGEYAYTLTVEKRKEPVDASQMDLLLLWLWALGWVGTYLMDHVQPRCICRQPRYLL